MTSMLRCFKFYSLMNSDRALVMLITQAVLSRNNVFSA
uniref:Uncharacterized protein n=1 Tax=Arundo donax TaxID=35708 RepID=A0A0A9GMV0_ARUDO